MKQNKWKRIATMAIPLVGGTIIGAIANRSSQKKYKKLDTPSFSPPGWIFPVAWTTLYTTMGIAKYKFDESPKSANLQKIGTSLYALQLSFNFLWSFLFFKWNNRGLALIDAIILWISIILNAYYFRKANKTASNLMIPYILWSTFAIALNFETWRKTDLSH